jgi:WD40 repeat protein
MFISSVKNRVHLIVGEAGDSPDSSNFVGGTMTFSCVLVKSDSTTKEVIKMNNYSFTQTLFALASPTLFFWLLVGISNLQAEDVSVIELKGHTGTVNFAAFSPDGEKVVTASVDKTTRIWDAKTGEELLKLEGHTDEVNSAVFSPDGKKILTASWDKTARIWDAESGEELKQFSGYDKPASYFPMNPLIMIVGGWEKPKSIRFASFSPDGKEIVTALNVTARIWDAESGEERQQLKGHWPGVHGKGGPLFSYSLNSALFSPDGEKIVTAGFGDHHVRVWDAKSGRELCCSSGFGYGVHFATFSPDGKKTVAATGRDIAFLDADSGKELKVFSPYKYSQYNIEKLDWLGRPVFSVNYSPDGKKLVIAAGDVVHKEIPDGNIVIEGEGKTPRIIDTESGKELQKLEGHTDQVLYADFSPDGKKIVTASQDNTARIWCVYPSDVLSQENKVPNGEIDQN